MNKQIIEITNKMYNKLIMTIITTFVPVIIKKSNEGLYLYSQNDDFIMELPYCEIDDAIIGKELYLNEFDQEGLIVLVDTKDEIQLCFYCKEILISLNDTFRFIEMWKRSENIKVKIKKIKSEETNEKFIILNKLQNITNDLKALIEDLIEE